MAFGQASLVDRIGAAWQRRDVALKAASFAGVGVINTLIDLCAFVIFYNMLHLLLIPANLLAWLLAVSGSYVMNSLTTFSAETGGKLSLRHYAGFVGSGIVAVTASTIAVVVADEERRPLVERQRRAQRLGHPGVGRVPRHAGMRHAA